MTSFPAMPDPEQIEPDKAIWRTRLLATRRSRSATERGLAQRRSAEHVLAVAATIRTGGACGTDTAGGTVGTGATSERGPSVDQDIGTVCAYLPLASEPLAHELPVALSRLGLRVLVPVIRPGAALDWCVLSGEIRPGPSGIDEPVGPRLGPDAVGKADLVLVPALAVDRSGVRLGRGGGHYDRTLALFDGSPLPQVLAVVYDDEVVNSLPHGQYDIRMTHVITPSGGCQPVGRRVADRGPADASLG